MNFKSIATVLLTTGITGFVTLGATPAPAQAALLKFDFTTSGPSGWYWYYDNPDLPDGTGSFFLDTSVVDENDSPDGGIFRSAIKDLNFTGGNGDISRDNLDLHVYHNPWDSYTSFHLWDIYRTIFRFDDPTSKLVNQLSSKPEDYSFIGGEFQSQNVAGLTVTDATAVPTPSLAFGLIGTGFLAFKRKMQKKEYSSTEA